MTYKQDYFGFVYLWFDSHRRKFCVGSHYGAVDDGYITSTGWMRKAYKKRPQDFKRRILYHLPVDCKKTLLIAEQKVLSKLRDDELGTRYYNLKKEASGGNGNANKGNRSLGGWNKGVTSEMLALRKAGLLCLLTDRPKAKVGRARTEEQKAASAKRMKERWEKIKSGELPTPKKRVKRGRKKRVVVRIPSPDSSKLGSQEWKDRISKKMRGRTAWNKGVKNPDAALNGKQGAEKMRAKATGRKRKYNEDGTWTWVYPDA